VGSQSLRGQSDGSLKWKFATGDAVKSSPAIGADGTIYVGSDDNSLYAISPDGSRKWEFATGAEIESSPAIGADGTIYVGSADNSLYAISPAGTQKWKFTTGSEVDSSPAIGADGTVYIGSWDHNVYAVGPATSSTPTASAKATGKPSGVATPTGTPARTPTPSKTTTPTPTVSPTPTATPVHVTWNGSVSSSWSNAANWTPKMVPNGFFNVVIPGGTSNEPTLDVSATIHNLTLSVSGASLQIGCGPVLRINAAGDASTIINNGAIALHIPGCSAGELLLDGGGTVSLAGTGMVTSTPGVIGLIGADTAGMTLVNQSTISGSVNIAGPSPQGGTGTNFALINKGKITGSILIDPGAGVTNTGVMTEARSRFTPTPSITPAAPFWLTWAGR